jgi:hypothetical protein
MAIAIPKMRVHSTVARHRLTLWIFNPFDYVGQPQKPGPRSAPGLSSKRPDVDVLNLFCDQGVMCPFN